MFHADARITPGSGSRLLGGDGSQSSDDRRIQERATEHGESALAGGGANVLQRVSDLIEGELDLDVIVRRLVSEAKAASGAEDGEFASYLTLPAAVRLADVPLDPRYATSPPDVAVAVACKELRSYLAVPVRSLRTGENFGALCLVHSSPNAFTSADEKDVSSIAMILGMCLEQARMIERSKWMEREYSRRAKQATLAADVAGALARGTSLRSVLQRCAEAVVRNLDAAFARIWTLDDEGTTLELQASAGMYTHLDGAHARVRLGMLKIGRIAADAEPHLTNEVATDPWVSDREWARRERLNSFAGYPLAFQGRVVGVLAMFSRRTLANDTVDALAAISDTIAVGIERVRADEELRKSEIRHRLVAESSQDGIWYWDIRKQVVEWNDRLYEILGLERDAYDGSFDAFIERVHPDDRERMHRAISAHLERTGPYLVESFRLRAGNGDYRICATKGLAEWDVLGNPVRMAGSLIDITERRRAERALLEERARFFNLLMGAPAAIAFLEGPEHRFVFANRQYEALVKRPLLGKTVREVFPEDRELGADLDRVIASGEALEGREVAIQTGEGRSGQTGLGEAGVETAGIALFNRIYEPTRNADGEVDGILIHAVDVTQQVTARREVEALNDALERRIEERTAALRETNRELEAFSYTVSHDLRAPIRHIAGFVDLLRHHAGKSLDAKGTRYVDTIAGAAKQMGLLIDGLLAFSRTGRTAISPRTIDSAPIVREVLDELQPDLAGRDVTIRVGDLPVIEADATMARSVIANLLANAVKYSSQREKATIEVGQAPEAPEGQAAIYVRDNGVGFDMAHVGKLFGVFQRLHGPEEFEGTGIGLATVRRIVQRHGGRVWAESAPDRGATFYFSFPRPSDAAKERE